MTQCQREFAWSEHVRRCRLDEKNPEDPFYVKVKIWRVRVTLKLLTLEIKGEGGDHERICRSVSSTLPNGENRVMQCLSDTVMLGSALNRIYVRSTA